MADQLEFTAPGGAYVSPSGDLPFRLMLELAVEDPDTIAELCQHSRRR